MTMTMQGIATPLAGFAMTGGDHGERRLEAHLDCAFVIAPSTLHKVVPASPVG